MTTRRDFLASTTLAGAGCLVSATGFWPGAVSAAERRGPNERLNIGIIGAGGRGAGNVGGVSGENIVALCDVDERRAAGVFNRYTRAAKYHDFRVMLEKQKDIDAVVVSTPDHQHAVAAAMAIRLGKHVYCEKPLTHDVYEARQLRLLASKFKVATQMGNNGTATNGFRTGVEVIRSGVLGDVREVHVWTNRPIWPQNIATRPKGEPIPKTLNWQLWLGTAPERSYNHVYVPHDWRGWWDFGTGAIGDMACHTMNLPFMGLRLGAPTAVAAETATPVNNETPPMGCTVTYEFPARGKLCACRFLWYERRKPPERLFMGQTVSGSGSLLVGTRATLYSSDDNGDRWRLLPDADFRGYRPPRPTLPRSPGHHAEWIRACKDGPPALSNFDYAGPLTEMALLGNVAIRAGQRFQWDPENLRTPGCPAAERYVRREYRKGWAL